MAVASFGGHKISWLHAGGTAAVAKRSNNINNNAESDMRSTLCHIVYEWGGRIMYIGKEGDELPCTDSGPLQGGLH